MAAIGAFCLLLAFVATAASVLALAAGHFLKGGLSETLSWAGRIATVVSFAAFTACCVVLLFCFLAGDYSIQYVLDQHSKSGDLLFQVAGLWAGREGSLLFWAWLISLFNAIVAVRRINALEPLDNVAVLIGQAVLLAFAGVLLFSEANMPFMATQSQYYESDGTLTTAAGLLGMNALLEHWAMAIHPPTLFVGYAGLTVPFAYAIAATVVNDPSPVWVERSRRYALVSWLFLTVGIGLGAVWAYVVLGWGGYWGWDPVENASLLPWLVCVALIHSFTQYQKRGMFKRWTVMCASLAFSFCILGTFISRSGLVQSVHAFEGDPVSLVLFGVLIGVSFIAGVIGCLVRRCSFKDSSDDEMGSLLSKEGAFYLNNLIMVVMATLLAYLTIAQALPTWLPFGGTSISTGAYDSIARPIGILFLLLLAVCPLFGWGKTNPQVFWRNARVPGICAMIMFAGLVVYFFTRLLPSYRAIIDGGGTAASELLAYGPSAYYNALAVVGFLVASLLLFNSLFQVVRAVKLKTGTFRMKLPALGSSVGHLAMAVILIGLVGSSMYVTEHSGYMAYDEQAKTSSEAFEVGEYSLVYKDSFITHTDSDDTNYAVVFDVYKEESYVGTVNPSVTVVATSQQRKYNAGVLSLPAEDVFVVYHGVRDSDTAMSLDVRVNPLINMVWAGFYLLCFGMLLAVFGVGGRPKGQAAAVAENASAKAPLEQD